MPATLLQAQIAAHELELLLGQLRHQLAVRRQRRRAARAGEPPRAGHRGAAVTPRLGVLAPFAALALAACGGGSAGRYRPATRRQARPGQPCRHAGAVDGHAEPRGARVQGGACPRLRARRCRRHRRCRLQSRPRADEGGRCQGGPRHGARCARPSSSGGASRFPPSSSWCRRRPPIATAISAAPPPPRRRRSTGRPRTPTPCRARGSSAAWSRPTAVTARRSTRRSPHSLPAKQADLEADRQELQGRAALLANRPADALALFEQSAGNRQQALDYRGMARALSFAGDAALRSNRTAEAADFFLRAGPQLAAAGRHRDGAAAPEAGRGSGAPDRAGRHRRGGRAAAQSGGGEGREGVTQGVAQVVQ